MLLELDNSKAFTNAPVEVALIKRVKIATPETCSKIMSLIY